MWLIEASITPFKPGQATVHGRRDNQPGDGRIPTDKGRNLSGHHRDCFDPSQRAGQAVQNGALAATETSRDSEAREEVITHVATLMRRIEPCEGEGVPDFMKRRPDVSWAATDIIIQDICTRADRFPTRLTKLLRGSAHRDVRLEETVHPVDRALLQLVRLFPWEHRDLGVGRRRGDVDRGSNRMSWYVIRRLSRV